MTKEKSSYGDEIQAALYDLLCKMTPYVKVEAQDRKFDILAYLPDCIQNCEGLKKKRTKKPTDITCYFRFRRTHCRRKFDKIAVEHKISGRNIYDLTYAYKGKQYRDDGLWNAIKKECHCDKEDCEHFKKELGWMQKSWREANKHLSIPIGLHTFEIKSDYDNHTRLEEQMPRALRVADYAWLVVGQKQTAPEWIPPYVGLLQYNEKKNNFKMLRRPKTLRVSFTYYRHVLSGEKFSAKRTDPMGAFLYGHIFSHLIQKWFINSTFYWDHECIIIDMTDELDHLAKTAHWVKTKREEIEDPKTIQKKLITGEYLEELDEKH